MIKLDLYATNLRKMSGRDFPVKCDAIPDGVPMALDLADGMIKGMTVEDGQCVWYFADLIIKNPLRDAQPPPIPLTDGYGGRIIGHVTLDAVVLATEMANRMAFDGPHEIRPTLNATGPGKVTIESLAIVRGQHN